MRTARCLGGLLTLALLSCGPVAKPEDNSGSANQTAAPAADAAPAQPAKPAAAADPTPAEASSALLATLDASGTGAVVYNPVGQVSGCVSGQDAGGRIVRTCNVCAVVLTAGTRILNIERSEFNLAFRRAISKEQPDIAPIDGGGVWVAAVEPGPMAQNRVARSSTYVSRELTDEDLGPLRMRRQGGFEPTVCLPPDPGSAFGMCVINGSRPVLNALSTNEAAERMREVVGSCP